MANFDLNQNMFYFNDINLAKNIVFQEGVREVRQELQERATTWQDAGDSIVNCNPDLNHPFAIVLSLAFYT